MTKNGYVLNASLLTDLLRTSFIYQLILYTTHIHTNKLSYNLMQTNPRTVLTVLFFCFLLSSL